MFEMEMLLANDANLCALWWRIDVDVGHHCGEFVSSIILSVRTLTVEARRRVTTGRTQLSWIVSCGGRREGNNNNDSHSHEKQLQVMSCSLLILVIHRKNRGDTKAKQQIQ